MQAVTVLGLWCTALSVGFVWPQVVRVYRYRTVEGVAPNGTLHGACASTLWLLYGLARGDFAISFSNAGVVSALLLIAIAQIRHRVLARRRAVAVEATALVVGAIAVAISPAIAGWLAIAVGATSVLPQALHVLRVADLSGVSVTTYGLLSLATLSWTLYGFAIGDPLVVVVNLLVCPCAVLVMAKAYLSQRRAEALPTEEPALL